MNRFGMIRQASHEIGVFVVLWVLANETQTHPCTVKMLLQSESGDIQAFIALTNEPGTPLPGLYERIFALLLILHFGKPRYGFVEEYILLPDIL